MLIYVPAICPILLSKRNARAIDCHNESTSISQNRRRGGGTDSLLDQSPRMSTYLILYLRVCLCSFQTAKARTSTRIEKVKMFVALMAAVALHSVYGTAL